MTRGKARIVSASDAAKNFGALVDRVRTERAEYIVERGGSPVVRVSPVAHLRCSVADLVEIFRSHAPADEDYLKAVEAGVSKLNKPSVPENRWAR